MSGVSGKQNVDRVTHNLQSTVHHPSTFRIQLGPVPDQIFQDAALKPVVAFQAGVQHACGLVRMDPGPLSSELAAISYTNGVKDMFCVAQRYPEPRSLVYPLKALAILELWISLDLVLTFV